MSVAILSKQPQILWQSILRDPRERLQEIYANEHFSDISITFPDYGVTYNCHRIILAMSSPVFEQMVCGPLGTSSKIEMKDDDPKVFKLLLDHCYGVNGIGLIDFQNTYYSKDILSYSCTDLNCINICLHLYKLADKYFMEPLKRFSLQRIEELMNQENCFEVLEFAFDYLFETSDLKAKWFETVLCHFDKEISLNVLSKIPTLYLGELLKLDSSQFIGGVGPKITALVSTASWRNAEPFLPEEVIHTILEHSDLGQLNEITGCFSAEIFRKIINLSNVSSFGLRPKEGFYNMKLALSDLNHGTEIINTIHSLSFVDSISIHFSFSRENSFQFPSLPSAHCLYNVYVSDVRDDDVANVIEGVSSLVPSNQCYSKICLPRSSLSIAGCKSLLINLREAKVSYNKLIVSSPNFNNLDKIVELVEWANEQGITRKACNFFRQNLGHNDTNISLCKTDKEMCLSGW